MIFLTEKSYNLSPRESTAFGQTRSIGEINYMIFLNVKKRNAKSFFSEILILDKRYPKLTILNRKQ